MTTIDPDTPPGGELPTAFTDAIALTALSELYQLAGLPVSLARKSARADIACGIAPRPGERNQSPVCAS